MDELILQFGLRFSASFLGHCAAMGYRWLSVLFFVTTVLIAISIEKTRKD